jgi:anti-sigma regulatory factor (Ser/Thr protein kinase)
MNEVDQTFTMTLDLSVLDHLGLNLYSNIPAVLSEAVANAWDADASRVEIVIDQDAQRITISDDGQPRWRTRRSESRPGAVSGSA